jgi:hypothetical protein
MSLLKYAIAAAAGYYAATPAGRRQVQQLSQKVSEFARSPKATELKERGREVVGDRASAVVDKVRRTSTTDAPASGADVRADVRADAPATGPVDRAVADDVQAAQTGVLPPGPASRTSGGV